MSLGELKKMQQVYTYGLDLALEMRKLGPLVPDVINTLEPIRVGDWIEVDDGVMVGRVVARRFVPRSPDPTDEADCILVIGDLSMVGADASEDAAAPSEDLWSFGDALSNTMRKFGLRQIDLYNLTGINPAQISEVTKGQYKLSMQRMELLIHALTPAQRRHLLSLVGGWGEPYGQPNPTD